MKTKELRQKNKNELSDTLKEKNKRIFELRYQGIFKSVKNVKEARNLKKDVARILTILKENNFLV